ncbi:MAG: oxidoreductase [Propionivibrio sp.]|nr:oxidoreductase [Propionivibrio sp.]
MADDHPSSVPASAGPTEQPAHTIDPEFLRGLREMAETIFPKQCRNCGNVYSDSRDFIERTVGIGPKKGVKTGFDDDDTRVLEFFRNCACGSTLHGLYAERRDYSENGERQREKFDSLLSQLVGHGIDRGLARLELRKLLRGEESPVLAPFLGHERKDIDLAP